MNDIRQRQDEAARQAREDLARAGREGELIGTSALRRAADHFSAKDAEGSDSAEIWGKRVARVAAVLFVLYLLWWLVQHLTR
jgi:hypothetical protein